MDEFRTNQTTKFLLKMGVKEMDENGLTELLVETRQKIRTANHAKCQLYSNIYQSICSTPLEDILYDNRPTKNIRDIMEEYLLYGYGDPKDLAAIIFKNTEKERNQDYEGLE